MTSLQSEDHLAPHSIVFDPEAILSQALLSQLASSTSVPTQALCKPFIRAGSVQSKDGLKPFHFARGLLDTGAQGSNFVSRTLVLSLPPSHTLATRSTDRIVRLGDARHVAVQSEIQLLVCLTDSCGNDHAHILWYSVLENLSHDLIIGLVDLVGPFYDVFADAIASSRRSAVGAIGTNLNALTATIREHLPCVHPGNMTRTAHNLSNHSQSYDHRKRAICASSNTDIYAVALHDGSSTDILSHPQHGLVYADNRVELQHSALSSLLTQPSSGDILPPWSQPIDQIAPEESETPDPTSFPDDILILLTVSTDEARQIYKKDLETHVMPEMSAAFPDITRLLTSDLAYDVFVPRTWTGIHMPPYHLTTKPGLPEFLKAHTRPIRDVLYQHAKAEFDRMKTYFYVKSTSPIACPLVVAPKATAPFIRLCGDYRPINPFVSIPQEPIPHVQQSLAKAAGWKVFVDLDMTNSFHQIPLDEASSNLLSVSTPWGLYRPLFLPEGVGPASGILQSIVRRVFADYEEWIIVIFDNFLILASDYADAAKKLDLALRRCREHGLVLKMKKSWIGSTNVTFFGYEVHPGTWSLSQSRKDAISALVFPTTQKQMQSFLGAANFFHTHIPNYASWASDLYECTASSFDWKSPTWPKDYRALFETFKTAIQASVTLHFPDYSLPWIIRSDSSDNAVGAVLFQEFTDSSATIIHQPIAFASHKYSGAAVNWDTYKKEAYAIYYAVCQFGYYLTGKSFVVETDHRNLIWMETSLVPIIIRWRVLLQSYSFQIKHIRGKDNGVADWLSRMHPQLTPPSPLVSVEQTPMIQEMFDSVHGHRSLHHGAKRTYLTLCQRYPGHGISLRTIQDLVAECPICQKDRIPFATVPSPSVTETLLHHVRSIGMDHVTVTPPDEDGYVGLLLLVEHDTKFPRAYPVRDYTAPTVATILFQHYCTFGAYDALYSDPGSAFTATVVQQLNSWIGIPHRISIIGRHESNGTEHVNGIFMGHLRRLVHDERFTHKWASDTILPLINHALATTPNSELGGLAPTELKFGTVDHSRFQLPPPLSPGHSYGEYVNQLNINLSTVRAITSQFQNELRQKRQASITKQNVYQKDDLILWNPKEHSKAFRSSKLAPKLLGPYTVITHIGNNVTCLHTQLNTQHVFHTDRISPYIGTIQSAQKIGLLDREEYIVESIVAHRGKWTHLKSIEFLVHWQGYTSDSDSWEPWTSLRLVQALHEYLQKIGHANKIPLPYRHDYLPQ